MPKLSENAGIKARYIEALEGIDPREFAAEMGVTDHTLRNWRKDPPRSRMKLHAIAGYLNVRYDWLVYDRGPKRPSRIEDPAIQLLVEQFEAAPSWVRDVVRQLLEKAHEAESQESKQAVLINVVPGSLVVTRHGVVLTKAKEEGE